MLLSKQLKHWVYSVFAPGAMLREKYAAFKDLLKYDDICLELIADLEETAYGRDKVDWARAEWLCERLLVNADLMVASLEAMNPKGYSGLRDALERISGQIFAAARTPALDAGPPYLLDLAGCAGKFSLAGGKAANLGRIAAETGLPTPPGFVVTANSFHAFMAADGLREKVDKLLKRVTLADPDGVASIAGELQELVRKAPVPELVAGAMLEEAAKLSANGARLAVRSSALAEDGEVSFAGQYSSELNVQPGDVLQAYKRVLSSKYDSRAITYRVRWGLADTETPMAVLVLPMVKASAAGVTYTSDPDRPETLAVYAVPGLGDQLVDGCRVPEIFSLSREAEPWVLDHECPLAASSLDEGQARRLAGMAMQLEELFGAPQDVEWALDATGEPFILQSRPLGQTLGVGSEELGAVPLHKDQDIVVDAIPVIAGAERVSPGVAWGPVLRADTIFDASLVEHGMVLAVPALAPSLVRAMDRVAAVVSASGSRASHFASVARESGLPVVVARQDIFDVLSNGQVVTVDADRGAVYDGVVEELTALVGESHQDKETPADLRLKDILALAATLSLTDPESDAFTPEGCRSVHDMVRFCHEMAVREMFSLVKRTGRGLGQAKRLETELPMAMYVLDLEGGVDSKANSRTVRPEALLSAPMAAMWRGLNSPDFSWSDSLKHLDWEEFDRVSGGIVSMDSKLLASYGVISRDYMHVMLRFGYHFSVLDSLCGDSDEKNYASLRFKGGGGGLEGMQLRLLFIELVLGEYGFETSRKGDMLDARYARAPREEIERRLVVLGRLLARTRMMDMELRSEEQVRKMAGDFVEQTKHAMQERN